MATGGASPRTTPVPAVSDPAAIPAPEPHFVQFSERQGRDHCFKLKVDLKKGPKDEANFHDLTVTLTALGNRRGGVCTVTDVSGKDIGNPKKVLGDWKRKAHDYFMKFLGDMYQTCVQHKQQSVKGLQIVVKSFPELASSCSHVYIRVDGSVVLENRTANLCELLGNRRTTPLPDTPDLPLEEGAAVKQAGHLEVKYWNQTSSLAQYSDRFRDARMTKAVLSVMNEQDGGLFIAGIEDRKNTVKGQQLDADTQEELTQFLEEYISGFIVVCGDSNVITLTRGVHYEIDYREVTQAAQSSARRVLIMLRFAGCAGLVCEKEPESYTVTDEGLIRRQSRKEWIKGVQ